MMTMTGSKNSEAYFVAFAASISAGIGSSH